MAHSSTIQQYALAAHEEQELQRQLELVRAEKSRLHPQVVAHLRDVGPVTCDINNTDEKVTLVAKSRSSLGAQQQGGLAAAIAPKSTIEVVVSTPNRISVE